MASKELNHEYHQTMAETDINSPPAQDSPKNIVNILNDDCIQLVLLNLKKLDDFWSAAQVCTRFQANARACFPFKESAEDFLSLFGPRIKSMHCDFSLNSKETDHEENLRLISQYCGQTLAELEIEQWTFVTNFNLRSPYQALKKLKLLRISFFNFNASFFFPELESLEVCCADDPFEWLSNKFPMLQHVKIYEISITDDIFIEFQNHNPQLQSLRICKCDFTSSALENIEDRLPNIVKLRLEVLNVIGGNITHFSALCHLRKLHIRRNMVDNKSFFSALVENNRSIEELKIDDVDIELGRILQRLKTIKVLNIELASEDIVVDLVKNLPALEYLGLRDIGRGIRFKTMRKILQNCKKMTKFDILDQLLPDGQTDLTEYDAIVALATGRVELNFEFVKRNTWLFRNAEYIKMLEDLFIKRNNEWVRFKPYR